MTCQKCGRVFHKGSFYAFVDGKVYCPVTCSNVEASRIQELETAIREIMLEALKPRPNLVKKINEITKDIFR